MLIVLNVLLLHLMLIFAIIGYSIIIIYRHNYYKRCTKYLIQEKQFLKRKLFNIKSLSQRQQLTMNKMKSESMLSIKKYEDHIIHLKAIISGVHFYFAALNNKNLSQLNSYELYCFIEFYKEIDNTFTKWIEKNCIQLTNREMIICILIRMGKEKQEIINILQCSDGAYRTIKNRIKCKLHLLSSKNELYKQIKEL